MEPLKKPEGISWDAASVQLPEMPILPPGEDAMSATISAVLPTLSAPFMANVTALQAKEGMFSGKLTTAEAAYTNADDQGSQGVGQLTDMLGQLGKMGQQAAGSMGQGAGGGQGGGMFGSMMQQAMQAAQQFGGKGGEGGSAAGGQPGGAPAAAPAPAPAQTPPPAQEREPEPRAEETREREQPADEKEREDERRPLLDRAEGAGPGDGATGAGPAPVTPPQPPQPSQPSSDAEIEDLARRML